MERLNRSLFFAFRASRDVLEDHLSRSGASIHDWVVLRLVGEGSTATPGTLAERLRVGKPTLTHHLNRLEAEGLVERRRGDPTDRRQVQLALTDAGRRRLDELDAKAVAADGVLRAALTDREATTLVSLLTKLTAGLPTHVGGDARVH